MSTGTIILLVVAVVVVLLIVGLVAMMSSRRKAAEAEHNRTRAHEIRHEAAGTTAVRDSDLEAREAQIEADRSRLEAEQAEARAAQAQEGVQVEDARREDQLREADRIDPDVDQRSDDYAPGTAGAPVAEEPAPTDGQRRTDRPD